MSESVTSISFTASGTPAQNAHTIATKLQELGAFTIISESSATVWLRPTGTVSGQIQCKLYVTSNIIYFTPYTGDSTKCPSTAEANRRIYFYPNITITFYNYNNSLYRMYYKNWSGSSSSDIDFDWLLADMYGTSDKQGIATCSWGAFVNGAYAVCDSSTYTNPALVDGGFQYGDIGDGETVCVPVAWTNAGKVKGINGDYFYRSSLTPGTYWAKFYAGNTLMLHLRDGYCIKI